MGDIKKLLHEPTFWFAVIFVGIIVGTIGSLLATYLRNQLDSLTAVFSTRSFTRKAKREKEREELISALIKDPLLFHAYTTILICVAIFQNAFMLLLISGYVLYMFISSTLTIFGQLTFLMILLLVALCIIATATGKEMPDLRILRAVYKRQRQNR